MGRRRLSSTEEGLKASKRQRNARYLSNELVRERKRNYDREYQRGRRVQKRSAGNPDHPTPSPDRTSQDRHDDDDDDDADDDDEAGDCKAFSDLS
jgi:hypothetical protein